MASSCSRVSFLMDKVLNHWGQQVVAMRNWGDVVKNLNSFQFIYKLYDFHKFIYFIIKKCMLKTICIRKHSIQLEAIEKIFYNEIQLPDQKINTIELPFYNFVCYTIDLMQQFLKSSYNIPFNIFIVDYHIRKYENLPQLSRRFLGFINSWRKYLDHEETVLLTSFLRNERNSKNNIKLFLKLRKILLKTINQKILQQINLTHQDTVTIIHTMKIISTQIKRNLTKKINQYFITKNIKYINNIKFNAATLCQFFMQEINDQFYNFNTQNQQNYNTFKKKNNKPPSIFQPDQDSIQLKQVSMSEDLFESNKEKPKDPEQKQCIEIFDERAQINEQEVKIIQHQRSLVNFEKCLKQLNILKQKDKQMDNRFKKLNGLKDEEN